MISGYLHVIYEASKYTDVLQWAGCQSNSLQTFPWALYLYFGFGSHRVVLQLEENLNVEVEYTRVLSMSIMRRAYDASGFKRPQQSR